MYYKIIDKLPDEMQVYKETPLDMEHPAYGVDRRKLRTPWERDYFTIENGNIKLISGRPDKTEFDGVKVVYPKGAKEICLFIEINKGGVDYEKNNHPITYFSYYIFKRISIRREC